MILVIGILPTSAPFIGIIMFGNLLKESNIVPKLVETAQNSLMYIVTKMLGLTVGATANAEIFLNPKTLGITLMGIIAFSVGTASGGLFGKIMCKLSKGKINSIIGVAGVVQKVG